MTEIKDFWKDDVHQRYPEGCDMDQFKHIPEISFYDHNYYVGFDSNLLYGHSDDDNTTEWYLVKGDRESIYLGISTVTGREKLMQVDNS